MGDRCYKCGRELLSTADFDGLCVYCRYKPSIPSPSPSEPTCPNCKAMREALHRIYELIDINRPYCDRCDDIRDIVMKFEGGR